MKITFSTALPSQTETECLVVPVLDAAAGSDNGDKAKHTPQVQSDDKAVLDAAADLIATEELTGKLLETALLYKPQGLKAKRLLFIGGGKATKFSSYELRKLGGAAVRTLKSKGLKSFTFLAPNSSSDAADAVKSIVEGGFIGNFDPNYYQSDREDKKIEELVIVAKGDEKMLQAAADQGRVIGEAQNFTRDLVNEPGNRMTPTILADRARSMSDEVGLQCEIYGPDKIKELKMGAFWSVAQGSDEEPRLIVMRYEPAGAPGEARARPGGEGNHLRHRRHLHQARRRHGEDEVRHGRRRRHDRSHARHRPAQAQRSRHRHRLRQREHALGQGAEARRRTDRHVRQVDRDHQHRRRRPARPRRRFALRPRAGRHPPHRRRHPHRSLRRRPRHGQCRHLLQQRRVLREVQPVAQEVGREDVASARSTRNTAR